MMIILKIPVFRIEIVNRLKVDFDCDDDDDENVEHEKLKQRVISLLLCGLKDFA